MLEYIFTAIINIESHSTIDFIVSALVEEGVTLITCNYHYQHDDGNYVIELAGQFDLICKLKRKLRRLSRGEPRFVILDQTINAF